MHYCRLYIWTDTFEQRREEFFFYFLRISFKFFKSCKDFQNSCPSVNKIWSSVIFSDFLLSSNFIIELKKQMLFEVFSGIIFINIWFVSNIEKFSKKNLINIKNFLQVLCHNLKNCQWSWLTLVVPMTNTKRVVQGKVMRNTSVWSWFSSEERKKNWKLLCLYLCIYETYMSVVGYIDRWLTILFISGEVFILIRIIYCKKCT